MDHPRKGTHVTVSRKREQAASHSVNDHRKEGRPRTPQAALQRLVDGNLRFTTGKAVHNQVSKEFLTHLAAQQRPFAAILGCSDSRVPPELVFDQGFGDLFVIRLAGNVIAPGVFGSIQYAHLHLGTNLLVVLGHEGCGAVKATLASKFHKAKHPERIQKLVDMIEPGLDCIDPNQSPAKKLKAAVEANVRWSLRQAVSQPETQRAYQEKRDILIVGAIYELATGQVHWLE
jgi:carbonic anhydrase